MEKFHFNTHLHCGDSLVESRTVNTGQVLRKTIWLAYNHYGEALFATFDYATVEEALAEQTVASYEEIPFK